MFKSYWKRKPEPFFKTDADGRTVYFPYGSWGSGYFVSDDDKNKIVKRYRFYYLFVFATCWLIFLSYGGWGIAAVLPFALLFDWWRNKSQLAGLERSPDRLDRAEVRQSYLNKHPTGLLVFYALIFAAFTFVSILVMLQDEPEGMGILTFSVSIFGTAVFVYLIREKRRLAEFETSSLTSDVEVPPPPFPTTEKHFFIRRPYASAFLLFGLVVSVAIIQFGIGIYGMTQCMTYNNDPEDRIAACDEIIAEDGFWFFTRADAHAWKGQALVEAERLEEAEASLGLALELDLDNYDGRLGLSMVRYKQQDYEGAIEQLNLAIKSATARDDRFETRKKNQLAWAYAGRGRAYEKLGKLDEAIEDYKASLTFSPDDEFIKKRLADLHTD